MGVAHGSGSCGILSECPWRGCNDDAEMAANRWRGSGQPETSLGSLRAAGCQTTGKGPHLRQQRDPPCVQAVVAVPEHRPPLRHRLLGGDEKTSSLVPSRNELEEQNALSAFRAPGPTTCSGVDQLSRRQFGALAIQDLTQGPH
jgi:hypothetical protein